MFLKINNKTIDKNIAEISILSAGTKIIATIEQKAPIKKGILFFKLLYCSIQSTTKSAVKENSKPAVLKSILDPTIEPKVEPTNQ